MIRKAARATRKLKAQGGLSKRCGSPGPTRGRDRRAARRRPCGQRPARSATSPREAASSAGVSPRPPLLDRPWRPALARRGRRAARASFGFGQIRALQEVFAETTPTGKLLHGPPRQRARLTVCVLPPVHGREAHPDLRGELLLAHAQPPSQGTDVPRVVVHLHAPPT